MAQTSVKAIPIRGFDTAFLTARWQPLYPDGIPQACFALRLINHSAVDVCLSFDGVTFNDLILSERELYLPAQMNNQPNSNEALFAKETIIYVSWATAAGVGAIYLTGYYV
jgi:hypothetical protein